MSGNEEEARPPIPLADVAQAILDLAGEAALASLAARFLELLRGWAAPSAVLAAAEDPGSESGWRLLPAVSFGTGPLGAERLIARLVSETPGGRQRPTLVKPAEETSGVRVRPNWIVPFSHAGEAGVLVVRGVSPGTASNLGDALLAMSSVLWPRLLGGPAERLEGLVKGVEAAAGRLAAEASRQVERLEQARHLPSDRQAELEAQLAKAREQAAEAARMLETSKERVAELEAGLQKAQGERDQAAARAQQQNVSAARIEELQSALAAAQSAEVKLREAEQQREQTRAEAAGLSTLAAERVAQAEAAAGAIRKELEALQREAASRAAHFDAAATALGRAAFVSEPLRTLLESAAPAAAVNATWLSVVLLDRDSPPPLELASALEAAGVRVRLAREPEELALCIRSPEASELDAVVCDIASFRPDQNVAGLIRAWQKDKSGLHFFLSRTADPAELERAKRVPLSLLAGHVQRPIQSGALVEAFRVLARKLGRPGQ